MTDQLQADEGILSLLPLSTCAKLAEHNKISEECMEELLEFRPELAKALSEIQNVKCEKTKSTSC